MIDILQGIFGLLAVPVAIWLLCARKEQEQSR